MEWKRIETRWYDIVGRLKQQDPVPAGQTEPTGVTVTVTDPKRPLGAGVGDRGDTVARAVI